MVTARQNLKKNVLSSNPRGDKQDPRIDFFIIYVNFREFLMGFNLF